MKHLLIVCMYVLLATKLFAQNNRTDEAAIKQVIKQQEAAWNRHDWEAFSGYFTDDGTLINFVGQFWKGRNDIVEHFKLLGDCCLSPTSLKFEFKSAKFLTPNIAVVYIEETLIADRDYDVPFRHYKKGETDYKMVTDVFVKTNNEWRVTAAQLTLINQIVSPHNSSDKH
ncbi:SgcJ/EcaC family oxidoreductase [Fibrella sp. HMF5335]|uniref:SgcJ/EcaC family oxidoreductase n=1 Tax=Fibrella rubiginis TaxID=2817060 RepID=A0A939K771_9BACT|nr:SgcJ/EcaC family oxidoreductase [Fibrella rubiginis]MBO0939086.1 SgcJ/EcaC family oxidoreductase [Fibrella rubiginis]